MRKGFAEGSYGPLNFEDKFLDDYNSRGKENQDMDAEYGDFPTTERALREDYFKKCPEMEDHYGSGPAQFKTAGQRGVYPENVPYYPY